MFETDGNQQQAGQVDRDPQSTPRHDASDAEYHREYEAPDVERDDAEPSVHTAVLLCMTDLQRDVLLGVDNRNVVKPRREVPTDHLVEHHHPI